MSNSDATAPAELSPPPSGRDSISRTGRQIRYGVTLMPWMVAYAEWLTLECVEKPKSILRMNRARGFARAPVSQQQLRLLEARPDFIEYCEELSKGPLEAARAKFASAFPTYVERHREALDLATDARDYTAMARLAEPVLDRVYPKKLEGMVAAQVVITLTPEQAKGVAVAYTAPDLLVAAVEAVAEILSDDDAAPAAS